MYCSRVESSYNRNNRGSKQAKQINTFNYIFPGVGRGQNICYCLLLLSYITYITAQQQKQFLDVFCSKMRSNMR